MTTAPASPHTWFITGASSGLGKAIADRAHEAGHRVVATARSVDALPARSERFLPLRLDVTDTASITAAVAATREGFGTIDVLVNNAGHGMHGLIEETNLDDARKLFDTNVFGLAAVTQAVLPTMRAQRHGVIVQISSVAAYSTIVGGGFYAATKHAVNGLSGALAQEVAPYGISVLCAEPGPFRTEFTGRSMNWQQPSPDFDQTARGQREAMHGTQAGDPDRLARVLVQVVDGGDIPHHLVFGEPGYQRVRDTLVERLAELDAHPEGRATDYPDATAGFPTLTAK